MVWNQGDRIPANLIVGFLGSGKTTAIAKLVDRRPAGEKWSIFVNEYGMVAIDPFLVDGGSEEIAVQELGGGCACCTMADVFQPLLARFIRRSEPDRLILEPSGASHPARVVDVLRSPSFSSLIELRNTICLIDPQDFEDPRWRSTAVFVDQIQLADVAVINWTDKRHREVIDRCREWVEGFAPAKLRILESSFGEMDPSWLDHDSSVVRPALFPNAHPGPSTILGEVPLVGDMPSRDVGWKNAANARGTAACVLTSPAPGRPLRVPNREPGQDACGWIFHVDDVFDRDDLLDLLGYVHPILRLKGIFRCEDDWWSINRAKDTTSYAPSAHRRDSRLEVILGRPTSGWAEFEQALLRCLSDQPTAV